jgi:hypothetical protein
VGIGGGGFFHRGYGYGEVSLDGYVPVTIPRRRDRAPKNARLFERRAPTSVILNRVKMKTDL